MKKSTSLLTLAVLLLWSGIAFADSDAVTGCPPNQKLRKIGNLQTGSANVDTTGHDVKAITVVCGGTACVSGVYDADTLGTSSNATAMAEPGAIANSSETIVFATPLQFVEGITVVDDGNVNAVILYECR